MTTKRKISFVYIYIYIYITGSGNKIRNTLVLLYTYLPYHNDSIIIKTDARRKIDAGTNDARRLLFKYILPLTLLQGFEMVVQGLHVRGCLRPNINFIF